MTWQQAALIIWAHHRRMNVYMLILTAIFLCLFWLLGVYFQFSPWQIMSQYPYPFLLLAALMYLFPINIYALQRTLSKPIQHSFRVEVFPVDANELVFKK